MPAFDRQREKELNTGKTFTTITGMNSARFGNEAHFISFAAIIASSNWTEVSNFHVWKTMIATIKISSDRSASIVGNDPDCTAILGKPCPPCFSNIRYATSRAWDAVAEMGGGACEMVFNIVLRFWCRTGGSRSYEMIGTAFHWGTQQGNVSFCEDESCGRVLWTRVARTFLLCRKRSKGVNVRFSGSFFKI
jgi:hypothetical protein